MPVDDGESARKEVAEGLKAILQRLADFFDIFDLSFIISGAVALGAFGFWSWRASLPKPPIPEGWVYSLTLIIASYVFGLLCFSLGRWLRVSWRSHRLGGGSDDRFLKVLKAHGLDGVSPFSDYLGRTDAGGEARLYVRLWAEVRDRPDLAASMSLLRRYWVMAATLDGVVVALLVWVLVLVACMFGCGGAQPISVGIGFVAILVLIISALACSHEAGRFVEYQIEELVGAVAAMRSRR
jgi:hypothetical protein